MKYSLKNEYKELLREELVSIRRKETNYKEEIFDVEIENDNISGAKYNLNSERQNISKVNNAIEVASQFTSESKIKIYHFLNDLYKPSRLDPKKFHGHAIRKKCPSDINEVVRRLNDFFASTIEWRPNAAKKVGRGEVSINLAFKTFVPGAPDVEYNHGLHKEPDFVALGEGNELVKFSVKSFIGIDKDGKRKAGSARTGDNIDPVVESVLKEMTTVIADKDDYLNILTHKHSEANQTKNKTSLNPEGFINVVKYHLQEHDKTKKIEKIEKLIKLCDELSSALIKEHGAQGIIAIVAASAREFIAIKPDNYSDIDNLRVQTFNGKRLSFIWKVYTGGANWKESLINYKTEVNNNNEELEQQNVEPIENIENKAIELASYKPQGKVLKEVYLNLFKKKLISEGGLAGHMMHPYEALDMTPRQIIDRIKEYSTSQKIIEKVDGQNLFFTVEQDGTLMFARNKVDMTHNDLVEKFTNHPAEVPFVTGGNAIKKGVDQWLSSAGAFGSQEILDIFHPDGEARSFINFEIMHKDHPNQLEYGENFIVFHSIVDFIDGREAVYSSNNSQRLDKLINLMKPGIESSDYTLASNRTVDINKLTNVQILSYIKRVKEIADQLEITDFELLGDGVEKQIKKQLDSEGIDISDEAIKILYDFALYGKDRSGNKIKSKDFTSLMQSEDVKKLRAIDLTNANKAAAKVRRILSPFKEVFVDLGIDLLDGVPSAYMDSETDLANIDRLRDKLETAIEDLRLYMSNTPESNWDAEVNRLKEHYNKIEEVGIHNAVSTSVEGGVYDFEGDLLKVTGGFAPLNQILGAAYRDTKGIFLTFKQKFMQQESNRRSLKSIFNLIF